jgi:hypothetical protein
MVVKRRGKKVFDRTNRGKSLKGWRMNEERGMQMGGKSGIFKRNLMAADAF